MDLPFQGGVFSAVRAQGLAAKPDCPATHRRLGRSVAAIPDGGAIAGPRRIGCARPGTPPGIFPRQFSIA
jgi:hypothetical protein